MPSTRWIGRGRAAEEYGLTMDQIDYAILLGLVRYKNLGGHGVIVSREDLERNLDAIKKLPARIWIYKSEAMKKYGLSRNQVELAMERGLVRFKVVKNPHYSKSTATLLVIPDIEANLDTIRSFPKYSEEERDRRRVYNERSKLRRKLEFYCPRCGTTVRPRRDSQAFEAVWRGFMSAEEALEKIVVAHYRHEHTDYDYDKENIDKWLKREEVEKVARGFKSFSELLSFYLEYRDEMDEFEREEYIFKLNTLRRMAIARAKEHYTEEAARLAEADGLVARKQRQPLTQEPEQPEQRRS